MSILETEQVGNLRLQDFPTTRASASAASMLTADLRGRLPCTGPASSDLGDRAHGEEVVRRNLRSAVISSWLLTIASSAASSISRLPGEVPAISQRYLPAYVWFRSLMFSINCETNQSQT